jgi:hypothetical protein
MGRLYTPEERYQINIDRGIIVDDEFAHLLREYVWTLDGYAFRTVRFDERSQRKEYLHHRIIGVPTPPLEVDHKNRNRLDNRMSNLRMVEPETNMRNTSASQDVLLSYSSRTNRYSASINIGSYYDADEALKEGELALEALHKSGYVLPRRRDT